MTLRRFFSALIFLTLLWSPKVFAEAVEWNDPTDSKPFVPWLWEDQLKPTIVKSWDSKGIGILLGGSAATALAHTQDDKVNNFTLNHDLMSDSWEQLGGFLGSGGPGVFLAVTQLWWDQPAGLQLARAMLLTTVTHVTLATTINRERPSGWGGSFPSGHTSNAFAIATSLAYSYGATVGVPAYGVATFIAASRISARVHWLSDVVAGAVIGIYWGRASALVTKDQNQTTFIYPVPIDGGAIVNFTQVF